MGVLAQALKDFLAPFLYIKVHRSLGLVHQGTIPDLALSRRVFLGIALSPLHTPSFCPALRRYPRKSAISKEKEWQSKWADKFLEVANKYNDKLTEYVVEFSLIAQASEEQLEGW